MAKHDRSFKENNFGFITYKRNKGFLSKIMTRKNVSLCYYVNIFIKNFSKICYFQIFSNSFSSHLKNKNISYIELFNKWIIFIH
jgi:hypothetical protein